MLLDYRDVRHPEAGGAEHYLNEVFQRVAGRGHRVTLLCARHGQSPAEETIGRIRVRRAGNKATANIIGARAALALARREPVDLFVENICKIPFLLPALTRVPVLPVVHHLFGHTVFYETNPLLAAYVWLHERLIPPVYKGLPFVAVSDSTAQDLARRGVRAARIDIVHNGIEGHRFATLPSLPRAAEPLLVFVGRLKRYKQIDTVLRAFAQVHRDLPQARLVFIGKGDDRDRLERLANALGLRDAVRFEGFVAEDVKLAWLRRAHALVYPSPKEGWGIGALEAQAAGTPVVASDAEGLRDAVRHEVTGFLVPHRSVDAWAQRMQQLLTDVAMRERMGGAARQWAAQFEWDVAADKMAGIIEQVAAHAPRKESVV